MGAGCVTTGEGRACVGAGDHCGKESKGPPTRAGKKWEKGTGPCERAREVEEGRSGGRDREELKTPSQARGEKRRSDDGV